MLIIWYNIFLIMTVPFYGKNFIKRSLMLHCKNVDLTYYVHYIFDLSIKGPTRLP